MTLLLGVFIASLLGSVHCGAMCSAFACLAHGTARRGAWYHGGRLAAYVALGVAAGTLGIGLDRAGLLANVQRTAALITSISLIVWGMVQFRHARRPQQYTGATQWGGVLSRVLARTSAWDTRVRAATIGVVTGLLPCGWLWAFVATAMGTGTPARGALVMTVFWAGTVPMLVMVAAGVRRWGPMTRVRWPLASATLVVALGVGELASHLFMPRMVQGASASSHVHGSTP